MKELIEKHEKLKSMLQDFSDSAYDGKLLYEVRFGVQLINDDVANELNSHTIGFDASVHVLIGLDPSFDKRESSLSSIWFCNHKTSLTCHVKRQYVKTAEVKKAYQEPLLYDLLIEAFNNTISYLETNTIEFLLEEARNGVVVDGKKYYMIPLDFPKPFSVPQPE
jgi:hypothetical protein